MLKVEFTGGQQILLDRKTNSKADIAVPKKSFGKIAGSFVDLSGSINEKASAEQAKADQSITIIAEGVETGLSIKQSMCEHSNIKNIISGTKTLCSLGISNIKNYQPKLGEKIIIAADNDGKSSNTAKTIESAKLVLEGKGAFVEIVRPEIEGDFNDILQDKQNGGTREIAKVFSRAIAKHSAVTLDAYFSSHDLSIKLDEVDKSNLEIIQKHNVSEQKIVDAYRKGDIYGKIELDKTRKNFEAEQSKLNIAKGFAADNKAVIDEAKKFGYSEDISETARSLVGMDKQEATRTCLEIRDRHFAEHLDSNINRTLKSFEIDKSLAKTSTEVMSIIAKEQNYLSEKHYNIKSPKYHRKEIYQTTLDAKTNMEKNIVDGLGKALEANQKQGIKGDKELMNILNTAVSSNISKVTKKLEDIADYEQKTYLRRHEIELKCLEKLNYLLDKDKLVSEVKSMDSEEKAKYINNILAKETKKYIEPLLAPHAEEKAKAKNLTEMMSALEKEHRTHCELFKKHEMAIYALDKSNGNMKLSVAISGANDISSFGGIKGVQKVIDHSINHNIRTEAQIFNNLKNKDLNIKMFSKELERECLRYHRSQVEGHLKDLSKNKVVTIESRRFNDKREYLNYLKDNRNHNYMPNDLINKQMQHIHNHDLKRSEQSEKHQDLQKELHLNKNIGGPSL